MHKFTTPLNGDSATALKTAQKLMADRGFAVTKINGGEVRGTRSHPFFGKETSDMMALVSEFVVRVSSSQLSAEITLGTLRFFGGTMSVIMGLGALFLILGFLVFQSTMFVWISMLTLAPWLVIGPAMFIWFRKLALCEVETLLRNSTAMAENE